MLTERETVATHQWWRDVENHIAGHYYLYRISDNICIVDHTGHPVPDGNLMTVQPDGSVIRNSNVDRTIASKANIRLNNQGQWAHPSEVRTRPGDLG